MKTFRPGRTGRLSYANVVATLALVIAVAGGTAYAANTVHSSDIVNGEVKTPDLADDAVKTAKIADGTVTNDDLGFNSVSADQVRNNVIPAFSYTSSDATPVNDITVKELSVSCDFSTDKVTGGGFVIADPTGQNVPNVAVQRSYAIDARTWLVRAVVTKGTPTWELTVVANCVS